VPPCGRGAGCVRTGFARRDHGGASLGADQDCRIHRARRDRRRCGPDGAHDPGRGPEAQADGPADRRHQQVRGAGAEGFLDVKEDDGNPHKIIITLSNLFTTPLATGVPFNWKDLTPVAMLALDEFILWVNADEPYQSAVEYLDAAKQAGPGKFKMGGTGSKQEDQIITEALQSKAGAELGYIPFKGGGDVAVQLVGGHVDSSVNNPIEAVAHFRSGGLRPLCVFDGERLPYDEKITDTMAWQDVPTCKESGIDVQYLMLRGIFMPPGVEQEHVDFYVDLFTKVRETPEWQDFMKKGAFNPSFMTGADFESWLAETEDRHRDLMTQAGFIAQ
jgi:tripartite-type tricarboxylate transporter receptor subunit TctC